MYITAQGPRLRNDLYCVEWDVKLYYYHTILNEVRSIVLFKATCLQFYVLFLCSSVCVIFAFFWLLWFWLSEPLYMLDRMF